MSVEALRSGPVAAQTPVDLMAVASIATATPTMFDLFQWIWACKATFDAERGGDRRGRAHEIDEREGYMHGYGRTWFVHFRAELLEVRDLVFRASLLCGLDCTRRRH